MRYLAIPLVVGFLCCGAAVAEEGPFALLSFEAACDKAAKENKAVFVDFYTTWCGPCKILDKTTLKDKKVVAWLKEKTVAIKVDADREVKLARKYRVNSYPTLLFLKSDGNEIDRILGTVPPEPFLAEGEAILSGKDAITRAKEKLAAAGPNNPMARMAYADVLARKEKYAEALKEFLWCYDEGAKHSSAFTGVRSSFLVYDIARLGEYYPPALEALRQRRDAINDQLMSDQANLLDAIGLHSLNEVLGEPEETLALYDRLRKEHPDSEAVTVLRGSVFGQLLKARRYAEIMADTDIDAEIERLLKKDKLAWTSALFMPKEQYDQMRAYERGNVVSQASGYYQVLIGAKKLERAAKLTHRVLQFDASAETYNELAWAGYMTGEPIEDNLEQARKARELSGGDDAAIIDTLARVLDELGHREEARKLLTEAIGRIDDPFMKSMLTQTQEDLLRTDGGE